MKREQQGAVSAALAHFRQRFANDWRMPRDDFESLRVDPAGRCLRGECVRETAGRP